MHVLPISRLGSSSNIIHLMYFLLLTKVNNKWQNGRTCRAGSVLFPIYVHSVIISPCFVFNFGPKQQMSWPGWLMRLRNRRKNKKKTKKKKTNKNVTTNKNSLVSGKPKTFTFHFPDSCGKSVQVLPRKKSQRSKLINCLLYLLHLAPTQYSLFQTF